jgi:hypothetical protein
MVEHIDFTDDVTDAPPDIPQRLTAREFGLRRQRLNMTWRELAHWMRVSYSAVHCWETRPDRGAIPLWVPIVFDYLELRQAVRVRKAADLQLDKIMADA